MPIGFFFGVSLVATAPKVDILANGIYTRRQAAYLARLRPQTASRWFDPTEKLGPAVRRHLTLVGDEPVVSFVELVQLMAVRAIRIDRDISLQKIREVVAQAEKIGLAFPLARNVRVFRWHNNQIVLRLPNGDFIEASGPTAHNYLFEPIILPYLDDITFNEEGLANVYRPKGYPGIVINPAMRWGAPVVESCGYTVETLVNAVTSEGTVERAARMCGVAEEEVKTAIRYEDFLRGPI